MHSLSRAGEVLCSLRLNQFSEVFKFLLFIFLLLLWADFSIQLEFMEKAKLLLIEPFFLNRAKNNP